MRARIYTNKQFPKGPTIEQEDVIIEKFNLINLQKSRKRRRRFSLTGPSSVQN